MMILQIQKSFTDTIDFLPVFILLAFLAVLSAFIVIAARRWNERKRREERLVGFQSDPVSETKMIQPGMVHYFFVTIYLVLFSLILVFFYPYAVNLKELGWQGLGVAGILMVLYVFGFIYVMKRIGK